jgi:predicted patatin/cPLA2 family phospholipase
MINCNFRSPLILFSYATVKISVSTTEVLDPIKQHWIFTIKLKKHKRLQSHLQNRRLRYSIVLQEFFMYL